MKFWQQFEINKLYALPNFEAISHVALVLVPENRPENLEWKGVSIKNYYITAKNISHGFTS